MKKIAAVSTLSLMLACALCSVSVEKPVHAQQMFQSLNYPTGLAGWWKLCGDTTAAGGCNPSSSTTVFDSSGYGNNGTWYGTKSGTTNWYSAGRVGPWAGYFDGTDNVVTASNNTVSTLIQTGSVSFTAWIYIPSTYAANSNIEVIEMAGSSGAGNSVSLTLGQYGSTKDGKLHMNVYTGSAYVISAASKSSWTAGWYFVAGTYSAANGAIDYINGTIDGSAAAVTRGTTPYTAYFGIGRSPSSSTYYFNGLINDVRVYNRELSAAEIAQMYLAHN